MDAGLGSAKFRMRYGVRHAYLAGSMYRAIASRELVLAMARAGLLSFFGAGGLNLGELRNAIESIQSQLAAGDPFGMNLLFSPEQPQLEQQTVDLYLEHGVRVVEAAGYTRVTPALVKYRLSGARLSARGETQVRNEIVGKVSRIDLASALMRPVPETILKKLVEGGELSEEEAAVGRCVPVCSDLCVEADSAGHTDRGVALAILPPILMLRDELAREHAYADGVHIGLAGGIGTPHAIAAALAMGADFVLTGSINQCTVEAGTSSVVKAMLQDMDPHDTTHAPAGDLFEIGTRVQVLKRGVLFPVRANKLYELYLRHASIDDIDETTRRELEQKYFGRALESVWAELAATYLRHDPVRLREIERNPKRQMACIFRWYFSHSSRAALNGDERHRADFQVHCGPALGSFNHWVRGTRLASWQHRHVADIAAVMVESATRILKSKGVPN